MTLFQICSPHRKISFQSSERNSNQDKDRTNLSVSWKDSGKASSDFDEVVGAVDETEGEDRQVGAETESIELIGSQGAVSNSELAESSSVRPGTEEGLPSSEDSVEGVEGMERR